MSFVNRAAVALVALSLVFAQVGCSGSAPPVPVSQVAADVATIANGLANALKTVPNLPPAATTALADLSKVAAALSSASSPTAQQSVAMQVEADVNAIVAAVGSLNLPAPAGPAITAAEVLLPLIEGGLNVAAAAAPASGPVTPAQALAILKAAAVK
jgi:hypothetical protein